MKKVIEQKWEYILYQEGSDFIFSVLCGDVALYEVEFELNDDEKKGFFEANEGYLKKLANMVREDPEKFQKRN